VYTEGLQEDLKVTTLEEFIEVEEPSEENIEINSFEEEGEEFIMNEETEYSDTNIIELNIV
jgi:hypothetical protein